MRPSDMHIHIMRMAYPAPYRIVLARIVLNAIFDPKQYPVDLSEVCALPGSAFAVARAFLEDCSINPWNCGSADPDTVGEWKRVLEKAQQELAAVHREVKL